MAQDVVAPQTGNGNIDRWYRTGARLLHHLDLPTQSPLPPVEYTPWLVTYVVGTYILAAALAVLMVRVDGSTDPQTLIVAGAAIFLMALYAIPQREPANINWTPTTFVHLGLSVTFGPIGAAVGAVAESLGVSIRRRRGWFRTFFNMSNHFLANIAAWAVFSSIEGGASGTGRSLAAGLAAGFVHFSVNSGFVAMVVRLSDPKVRIVEYFVTRLWLLPISIAYGFAAFTFVIVHTAAHSYGFLALLAPVIVLHVYLIYYEQNAFAHDQETKAFAEERQALLRKEADAADRERTKIAADLHDGVVQDLTGMQLQLYNAASQLRQRSSTDDGRDELIELLEGSATETRKLMKDLRTLIIDLVPPTFRREGLQSALLEVLRTIEKQGTSTELAFPETLRLRKDRSELIFLVAKEMLRNVAAHAHAKNVIVQLTTEDGSAILSIQDDGKGFTAADIEKSRGDGHLGSSAAVDRVEAAGGTLITDSEPGRGTLVVLTLPI